MCGRLAQVRLAQRAEARDRPADQQGTDREHDHQLDEGEAPRRAPRRCRYGSGTLHRALRLALHLPGLDVVAGALCLVRPRRADVGALRIFLARATQQEVLAPWILAALLADVLLPDQVFHAAR